MIELKKKYLNGLDKISRNGGKLNSFTDSFEECDLEDLINWGECWGYTDGIKCGPKSIGGGLSITYNNPRLTLDGKDCLRNLENPIPQEKEVMEVKVSGLDEIIKALVGVPSGKCGFTTLRNFS